MEQMNAFNIFAAFIFFIFSILFAIALVIIFLSMLGLVKIRASSRVNISRKIVGEKKRESVPISVKELTGVHDFIINEFIDNLEKPIKTPYLMAVYGGSGSGKSFVSEVISGTIKKIFPTTCANVTIISQDSYYKGGNKDTDYDVPESIDFDLLTNHIEMLLQDKTIECPTYDFVTHQRTNKTVTIIPCKIIIVEGILICTQERLRNLFNMKIFIDAKESTQVFRRLKRDIKERGRTIEEVENRYKRDVAPSYQQHVLPSANFADMRINNDGEENYVGLETVLNHIITVLNKICRN